MMPECPMFPPLVPTPLHNLLEIKSVAFKNILMSLFCSHKSQFLVHFLTLVRVIELPIVESFGMLHFILTAIHS